MQTERTRTNQSLFYTASELSTLAKRKWAGGLREAIKSAATRRVGACLDGTRNSLRILSNSELRPAPRIPPDRWTYLILEAQIGPKTDLQNIALPNSNPSRWTAKISPRASKKWPTQIASSTCTWPKACFCIFLRSFGFRNSVAQFFVVFALPD